MIWKKKIETEMAGWKKLRYVYLFENSLALFHPQEPETFLPTL